MRYFITKNQAGLPNAIVNIDEISSVTEYPENVVVTMKSGTSHHFRGVSVASVERAIRVAQDGVAFEVYP